MGKCPMNSKLGEKTNHDDCFLAVCEMGGKTLPKGKLMMQVPKIKKQNSIVRKMKQPPDDGLVTVDRILKKGR